MIKEGHFGLAEAYSLMVITMITKTFYISPQVVIKALGTAAWMGTLISCSTCLAFFFLLYTLMKRFSQMDLYQIFEAVAGKWPGKGLILIFSVYLVYYTSVNIREFLSILMTYSMPTTPLSFLIFFLLLVVVAMAYVGIEGIARVAYVYFYIILGGFFLLIILAIPSYDLDYLKPFLGNGIAETVKIGVSRIGAYNEIIFLAIIIRTVHGVDNFKKIGILSILTTGAVFVTTLVSIIAAFQYTVGGEHLSGMYQLSRVIYYSRFFQRVESIFIFIWVISSVICISFAFYLAVSSYCRAFEITNHRPLLFPFAILTYLAAHGIDNIAQLIEIHLKVVRVYSSAILVLIPILILMLAVLRGKKAGKENAKAKAKA